MKSTAGRCSRSTRCIWRSFWRYSPPVAFFLGWVSTLGELLILAAIMSLFHVTIFLIMCARYRAEVRELNELNLRRQRNA